MADLLPDEDRESWLVWAIELMRRGLRPSGEIVVHGPHAPPGDHMWGEAECQDTCGDSQYISFHTSRCRSIWDVRGVRVTSEHGEAFPILKATDLPSEWRKDLSAYKAERRKIREDELDEEAVWKKYHNSDGGTVYTKREIEILASGMNMSVDEFLGQYGVES